MATYQPGAPKEVQKSGPEIVRKIGSESARKKAPEKTEKTTSRNVSRKNVSEGVPECVPKTVRKTVTDFVTDFVTDLSRKLKTLKKKVALFTLPNASETQKTGPKQGPKRCFFPVVETQIILVIFVSPVFATPKRVQKPAPKKTCKLLDLRRALVRPQNAANCSTL